MSWEVIRLAEIEKGGVSVLAIVDEDYNEYSIERLIATVQEKTRKVMWDIFNNERSKDVTGRK